MTDEQIDRKAGRNSYDNRSNPPCFAYFVGNFNIHRLRDFPNGSGYL
jgi:hypothetical protein